QVERDFGSLKKIVDVHSGPMDEDGDTASWLVEIFADGPKSDEEVATRLESSSAEGSDEVVLEATPFTRECAEMWVATFQRRFRIYSRGQKTPGPKPKERPQPRPGTMARVAYNDKFARDALVSRVSDARSDITLAGDSRKSLQVRSVGSAGGVDGLEQVRKTTALKRTKLQKLNQGRAAAYSEKKNPFRQWHLNPNNRLRLGIPPASSGGSATPQPWPVSGIKVFDCATEPVRDIDLRPGQYLVARLRIRDAWIGGRDADLVVWDSPWQLDTRACADNAEFIKIAFIVVALGKAVLPRSAWKRGPEGTLPHLSQDVVYFKGAAKEQKLTLAVDDAFRQKHPNVVSVIEKASANSLWQIVRAEPVVAAAHPKAKAKSKARSKAKAKAKATAKKGQAESEVVRLSDCHAVRALLQRVRRVHRQGGVASEYVTHAERWSRLRRAFR
ncbi:MAG: hypothetical protein VX109_07210, partial [Planctomycetota bacterium]|nr:hypothetical protein [Planctomycetota bacterium]